MPKAKKSSSSLLSQDFKKQRTKLGKGKKPGSNATDTSFKARSIALPQQSISKERSSSQVTRRNQSIHDLVGQLRHYNANVRKDAISGLEEIFIAHPETSSGDMGVVATNVARLVADEDAMVRRSMLSFMDLLFERAKSEILRPYASTIILYTTSAMSHIYPDIRIDAVKTADLCLKTFGDLLLNGWDRRFKRNSLESSTNNNVPQSHGERLLDCYMTLLGSSIKKDATQGNSTAKSSASVISTDLSPGSRLVILTSLTTFLEQTRIVEKREEREKDVECPVWFFSSSFANPSDFLAFERCLRPTSLQSFPSDPLTAETRNDRWTNLRWNTSQFVEAVSTAETFLQHIENPKDVQKYDHEEQGMKNRLEIYEILQSMMLATFLDSAPSAFSPDRDERAIHETPGQLVLVVARLALALWRGAKSAPPSSAQGLSRLLARMAVYFPFGGQDSSGLGRPSDTQKEFVKLNLAYCELVGILAVVRPNMAKDVGVQFKNVNEYILTILRESSSSLRDEAFVNVLPTVWLLLNSATVDSNALVSALLYFWEHLPTSQETKKVATGFVGRLLILPIFPSYSGRFEINHQSSCWPALSKWLVMFLPQYLWELNVRDHQATEIVLELLRFATCLSNERILNVKEQSQLQKPLSLFFHVQRSKVGPIDGPYARLPEHIQRRARGLLSYLSLNAELAAAAVAVGAV